MRAAPRAHATRAAAVRRRRPAHRFRAIRYGCARPRPRRRPANCLIRRILQPRPAPVGGPRLANRVKMPTSDRQDRMLRVMLVDDSQKDVSLLKEGLRGGRLRRRRVTTLAAALLDRVAALAARRHHHRHRFADARHARATVVRQRAGSRGRSCCSPRTATTRRSRRRSRRACRRTSSPACSRIACSRSSTSPSRASSRSARCARSSTYAQDASSPSAR